MNWVSSQPSRSSRRGFSSLVQEIKAPFTLYKFNFSVLWVENGKRKRKYKDFSSVLNPLFRPDKAGYEMKGIAFKWIWTFYSFWHIWAVTCRSIMRELLLVRICLGWKMSSPLFEARFSIRMPFWTNQQCREKFLPSRWGRDCGPVLFSSFSAFEMMRCKWCFSVAENLSRQLVSPRQRRQVPLARVRRKYSRYRLDSAQTWRGTRNRQRNGDRSRAIKRGTKSGRSRPNRARRADECAWGLLATRCWGSAPFSGGTGDFSG